MVTPDGLAALRQDMSQRDGWLARTMAARLTSTEQELLRLAGQLLERLAEADAPPVP